MFVVERHYLNTWSAHYRSRVVAKGLSIAHAGASFAENFYGMKRRRRPGVTSERAQAAVELFTDHEKLRKREIRWSLFFVVRAFACISTQKLTRYHLDRDSLHPI